MVVGPSQTLKNRRLAFCKRPAVSSVICFLELPKSKFWSSSKLKLVLVLVRQISLELACIGRLP